MATDEEYLDNLLKSLTDNGQQPTEEETNTSMALEDFADFSEDAGISLEQLAGLTDDTGLSGEQFSDLETQAQTGDFADFSDSREGEEEGILDNVEVLGIPDEYPAGLPDVAEPPVEEPELYDLTSNTENMDDVLEETGLSLEQLLDLQEESPSGEGYFTDVSDLPDSLPDAAFSDGEAGPVEDEYEDWKMDIDDLLAETDDKEGADAVIPEEILPTGGDVPDVENVDITDLIDNMDNTDSDLDEINSLLKKADGSQGVDDDMLALLEGIEEPAGRDDGADDEFDIFADMPTEKNKAVDPPGEEKKAKNKKRPPKGKKKAGKNKGEPEELERETGIQSVFGDRKSVV